MSSSSERSGVVLRDKVKRASELHAELEHVLQNHAKRVKEEQARPFGSGFMDFMRQNRAQMINIGASFVCVMLAFQVVNLRRASKKLEGRLEESQRTLSDTRQRLQSLTEPTFLQELAQKCQLQLQKQQQQQQQNSSISSGGAYWRKQNHDQTARASEWIITRTLQEELEQRVGDAGLSEEQKKQRLVHQLQEPASLEQASGEPTIENMLVEVTQDGNRGTRVVKKRMFSI